MIKLRNVLIMMTAVGIILTGCNEADENSSTTASENSNEQEATDYPTRTIDFYVGFGAGGGTDLFTRQVARQMEEILDTNINVVNQEGGDGTISLEHVANQPADGYTVAAISAFPITTADEVNAHGLDVFQPIARFQDDTFGIVVPSGTFNDIDEFTAYVEENPGELNVGGVAVRGPDRMAAEIFMNESGLEISYVPFDGTGDAVSALLGGHVDALIEEPGPLIDYINDGEITPLAFFAEDRLEDFPDVPVSVEKGWDITHGVERGFAVLRDTPDEIINILEEAMEEVYNSEEYQEYEEANYLHYKDGWLNSEDYDEQLKNSIEMFEDVLEGIED